MLGRRLAWMIALGLISAAPSGADEGERPAIPVERPLLGRVEFTGVPERIRVLVFPHIGPYVTPHGKDGRDGRG